MRTWTLIGMLALLLHTSLGSAQVAPEKALSTFQVVDGLQCELFAAEPLFVNPTCMDVDHQGRVWICESVNYRSVLRRQPFRRAEGDRIVILQDTTGTGKADRATTFYQSPELLAPLGIAVIPDAVGPGLKVLVCQSPDILVFEDKNGDLKADGPPTKLLTGFRGIDHDHGVHSILVGPDRKLYFTVGDAGVGGLKSSDGKGKVWTSNGTDCRAGTVWRCDLDGKNLELLAHNFRNNYEVCVDSFGTLFLSDNDDDGNQQTRICHVMPGGNYGYHPRGPGQTHWHEEQPGVVPKILRTYFGSPTGICMYEGKLLPEKYRGQILHTDAGPRHVRCYHLKPTGASYEVDREDMVQSTDSWFRPSDVCVAPDGSVFVCDWYDPGVGGHGMGDTTRGRVFRITPSGHKGYTIPSYDLNTREGVLSALSSPNLSARAQAMARFEGMKLEEVIGLATEGLRRNDPILSARLGWQVARLGRPDLVDHLSGVVGRENLDVRIRVQGVRALKGFLGKSPADLPAATSLIRSSERSPALAREQLLELRDADPKLTRPLFIELAKRYDGKDRFYLAALGICVGQDPQRREILLAGFEKDFPELNARTLDLVWELRPPAAMALLEKRLRDQTTPISERARIVDILATSEDPRAGASLLALIQEDLPEEMRGKILDNLKLFLPTKWSELRRAPALTQGIDQLLAKPETATTGLALIAAAERTDLVPRITRLLGRTTTPSAVQEAAVRALGALPSEEAIRTLRGLLKDAREPLGVAVVHALGQALDGAPRRNPASKPAAEALRSVVVTKEWSLVFRQAAVATLAGSRSGSEWLLEAAAQGNFPTELRAEAGRVLRNSAYPDLRNKARLAFPPPGALDPKKLPAPSVLALRRGDAGRGKQLLAASLKSESQCLKCHTVRGQGGQVGPDLSMIGKKASRENLFESILYPSKAVADQYIQWVIETKQGITAMGLLVEETPEALTLRDANGKDTRFSKKEIETRSKSPNSIMPADGVAALTEEELVDMVEYLATLKSPSFTPDFWHVLGPFENGPDRSGLSRELAPEKGIDLKASYPGKGGRVSWRVLRPGSNNYVDLAALHGTQGGQSLSYLTREFESPVDQDATLLLGTDDGARVWLNGRQVFRTEATRAAAPEQETIRVRLRKGINQLLIKIDNGDGPHGLYATLETAEELKR